MPNLRQQGGPKEAFVPGPREEVFLEGARLQGEGGGEEAGIWEPGHSEPLWIITDLSPQEALSIYRERMAIEEGFRDLKGLLGLERLMNKAQGYLEGMVASVLMAYGIGLMLGEVLREMIFGNSKRYRLYSGLFVLRSRPVKWCKKGSFWSSSYPVSTSSTASTGVPGSFCVP